MMTEMLEGRQLIYAGRRIHILALFTVLTPNSINLPKAQCISNPHPPYNPRARRASPLRADSSAAA